MSQVTFDEVLDAIEHLPVDEQADLLEIVRRRLAEGGRNQVIEDIDEGRAQFSGGNADPRKPANVDEMMRAAVG